MLSVICIGYTSYAQVVWMVFPDMQTETVENKSITLPSETKGKYAFVGLAYSKKSNDELATWFQPVYEKFIDKSGGIFGFTYDVNVYFVPMFTGVKAAAAGTAKKRAAALLDSVLLPHVLFYTGDLKPYKESLSFDKKDVPYFFVLSKEGKILYATSGKYVEEKMDEIEAVLGE